MKVFKHILLGATVLGGALAIGAAPVSAAVSAPATINATSTPGSGVITVKWSAVTGATSYQAQVLIGTVPIKTSTAIASTATRTFTFIGLEYNIPYNVKVRASDGSSTATGNAAENPIIPVAGQPSTPAQPTLSVTDDYKLKASWAPPSSNGGSPIESYSVQLISGGDAVGVPVIVTGLEVELTTKDKTNSYSVTVAAINEADVKSEISEESTQMVAEKKAVAAVDLTPIQNPTNAGGNNPTNNGGNTPATGGGNSPSVGNNNSGVVNSPAASSPSTNQLVQVVSPSPVVPAYTKVVTAKSTITSKTLINLSKLATPKGSKTSFTIATSSKKYCQLKGTSVKNLKAGTCSVKVTVTTKSGKKTSRTVKLIAR